MRRHDTELYSIVSMKGWCYCAMEYNILDRRKYAVRNIYCVQVRYIYTSLIYNQLYYKKNKIKT